MYIYGGIYEYGCMCAHDSAYMFVDIYICVLYKNEITTLLLRGEI